MTTYVRSAASLPLLSALLAAHAVAQPAPLPAAIDRVPADAMAIVVFDEPDRRVGEFRALLDQHEFWDTGVAAAMNGDPKFMQARVAMLGLAAACGADPWDAVAAVAGRQIAVGVAPGSGAGPRVIAVAASRKPDLVRRLYDGVAGLAGLHPGGKPDPDRSFKVGDALVLTPAPRVYMSLHGDALIVANDRSWMEFALEARRDDPQGAGASARLREARRAAPESAWAIACADLGAARELLVATDRTPEALLSNPLAAFLFGGWWLTLRQADAVSLSLSTDATGIHLDVRADAGDAPPESHRGFRPPAARRAAFSAAALSGAVGEIRISREWAALFAEREALLTLPAAGQVVNFSNTLTTLLGGIDFMNDFLPRVDGPARLIAVLQDFSGRAVLPTPRLPAFALVAPLSESAGNFQQRLLSGAQMAMALLNFDQAQNNRPMMILDMDKHRGQRIYLARYADDYATGGMNMKPVNAEDDADAPDFGPVQLNFAPAATVVDNHLVVATSLELCKQIMDALGDAKSASPAEPTGQDEFWLDAAGVVAALRENKRELVTNRMLEADRSREDATREIDALLELLGHAERFSVRSTPTEKGYRVQVSLLLRAAAKAAGERP